MAVSFYDVSIASFLQQLDAVPGVLAKGRQLSETGKIGLDDLYQMRLAPDMLPFWFQIASVCHHSLGAIRGIEAGRFEPPTHKGDTNYDELEAIVESARTQLRQYSRESIESLAEKPLVFKVRDREMPFIARDFVLSFSLPNFYFHATTAYDMLRIKGAQLGKIDYLGKLHIAR